MLKAQAIPTWPTPTMVTLLPEWATGVWISVLSLSTLVAIFLLSIIQADNQINTRVAQLKRASVSGGTTIKTGTSLTLSWYGSLTTFKMVECGNSVKKRILKMIQRAREHERAQPRNIYECQTKVTLARLPYNYSWPILLPPWQRDCALGFQMDHSRLKVTFVSNAPLLKQEMRKKPEPWILQFPISMNLDLVLLQKRDY